MCVCGRSDDMARSRCSDISLVLEGIHMLPASMERGLVVCMYEEFDERWVRLTGNSAFLAAQVRPVVRGEVLVEH
jgi:hypothetical protein